MTVVTSIRLTERTLARLRAKAHRVSLHRGVTVTWQELVRQLIEQQLLAGPDEGHDRPGP